MGLIRLEADKGKQLKMSLNILDMVIFVTCEELNELSQVFSRKVIEDFKSLIGEEIVWHEIGKRKSERPVEETRPMKFRVKSSARQKRPRPRTENF